MLINTSASIYTSVSIDTSASEALVTIMIRWQCTLCILGFTDDRLDGRESKMPSSGWRTSSSLVSCIFLSVVKRWHICEGLWWPCPSGTHCTCCNATASLMSLWSFRWSYCLSTFVGTHHEYLCLNMLQDSAKAEVTRIPEKHGLSIKLEVLSSFEYRVLARFGTDPSF